MHSALLDGMFCMCSLDPFANSVQNFHFFADFLSSSSIICWDWSVNAANSNRRFVCFSFLKKLSLFIYLFIEALLFGECTFRIILIHFCISNTVPTCNIGFQQIFPKWLSKLKLNNYMSDRWKKYFTFSSCDFFPPWLYKLCII